MAAATYVRMSGHHVAERIRPVPDTEEEQRLAALADDPETHWMRVPDEGEQTLTERPAQAADKAAWVAWAVAQGAAQADAEAATKADLITQYGKGDA